MKELLAKIRGAKAEQKCQVAAEVCEKLESAGANLMVKLDRAGLNVNVPVWDLALDQLDEAMDALETFLTGLETAEVKRLKSNLEKDYDECLELGRFYEWLNPDGKSYTADYAEFAGQRFEVPTKEEILAALTSQKLKLYKQMEKDGLEPKLQITPLAFNIRTLGKMIDAKRADLKINIRNTFFWDGIKDEELQYAPTIIKASKDGKQIEITGGITKSQYIQEYRGFLVEIVSMKQNLEADKSIQKDAKGEVNYNAIQAEKYAEQLKQTGFNAMTCEAYLSAQMRAIKNNKPLGTSIFTLLLESSLQMSQYLALGYWRGGYVDLGRLDSDGQDYFLRVPGAVKVL